MYRFVDCFLFLFLGGVCLFVFFSQKASFSGKIHISHIIRVVAMQTVCLIITIAMAYLMVLKGNICMRKCCLH